MSQPPMTPYTVDLHPMKKWTIEMGVILDKMRTDGLEGLRDTFFQLRTRRINGGIFVQFTGYEDSVSDDKSWSPECAQAEPVFEQAIDALYQLYKKGKIIDNEQYTIIYIICNVGGRANWESETNDIKADRMLDVKSIPALIEYSLNDGYHPVHGRKLDKLEQLEKASDIVDFILRTVPEVCV